MDVVSILSTFAPWILGAIVLVFLYNALASNLRIPSLDAILSQLLGPGYAKAQLDRLVARHKQSGNVLVAGKLLEDVGRLQEAADIYLEGAEHFAAATVFEKMGRHERAAELYLQAGDHKKAADVFIKAGKPAKAAALFEAKGNKLDAARLYATAQMWDKAAELYSQSGYPLRAAETHEKKGDYHRAAECYEKHFMENVTYSTTYSSTAQTQEQRSALLAGRLFEKAGDLARAREILFRGGYFKEAAQVCMKQGDFAKAAELFLRAEDPARAADAFEKAGDEVQAATLRGEVALKDERLAEAARFFQQGRDYQRAAELFEQIGMLAEAAAAYEAAESWAAAGSVYIRAGLKERAAAAYEWAGEFETAAKLFEEAGHDARAIPLFEKAGLTFKSGEAAAKAGERDRAIALLQRVPPSDENYRTATEMLARLFIEAGMPQLALERLQKALHGQAVSAATLDLFYWLGAAFEASGQHAEAVSVYKKIQAEDLQFRDVAARVSRAEVAAWKARAASPPAPAAPVAAASAAEERKKATLHELQARGIATVQVCPSCGRCYDHTARHCEEDRAALKTPRVVPYVLLDRYRLVRVLGEGGMGIVFDAHDQRLDRNVAIKIVRAEELGDASSLERLEREARVVAKLRHPGVIAIYDSGELADGSAFLVMELIEGCDLAHLMKAYGRGRPSQVASLLRQAAGALAAAHRMGVIHRDIKPQNILLTNGEYGFQVKVLDFGIAKSTAIDSSVTQTGMIVGTPSYMSPEQAQNKTLDARSDLYALAAVGFEALTGSKVVPDGEILKMLFAVINEPPPKVSARLTGIPSEIDAGFTWALAKDPAARPADVETWVNSIADPLECLASDVPGWPDQIPALGLKAARAGTEVSEKPTALRLGAAAPTAKAAGTELASPPPSQRFVSREEVGRGPLGIVYRAEDTRDGRSVALRVLPAELLKDGVLQAFVADLKAAAQLSHPNLVKVLGFVDAEGSKCVVTEFVDGKTFAEPLLAGRKMAFQQAHGVGRTMAQTLAFVHSRGLVHGSVQPSNLMVVSGVIKLADLGLARLARTAQRPYDYRAPEELLDVAGDIYAAAAVLYHLVTGVHPKTQAQGIGMPLPSSLVPGIPDAFDKLLIRCLHPRPESRLPTAEGLLDELKSMVKIG